MPGATITESKVEHSEGSLERAAILEHDGGLPRQWADMFALFVELERPDSIPAYEWCALKDDAARFLERYVRLFRRDPRLAN